MKITRLKIAIAWLRGDLIQARQHLERALTLNRAIGYRQGLAFAYYHLGCVLDALHDNQARHYFSEALQLAVDLGLSWLMLGFAPGVANYLVKCSEDQLAVEFLSLTINDLSVESWTRLNAQRMLTEITAQQPPAVEAITVEANQVRDLAVIIDELLEKLLK